MGFDNYAVRPLRISDLDLSEKLDPAKYDKLARGYEVELVRLQRAIRDQQRHVILVFEGLDAAGKGGAIKRLTQYLDPRNMDVHAIAAPTQDELRHHYLRRFWVRLPPAGKLAIFDRSWYGRMLVEPIEHFCSEQEYEHAAQEIREFERVLSDAGYLILKFWLHVDKDEQLRRFKERESDPLKEWKIGPEDWRNREHYDEYVRYAEMMFAQTDAPHAQWVLVAGNDKFYARMKVLETVAAKFKELCGNGKNNGSKGTQTSIKPSSA